jgi:hypothetical protein
MPTGGLAVLAGASIIPGCRTEGPNDVHVVVAATQKKHNEIVPSRVVSGTAHPGSKEATCNLLTTDVRDSSREITT